MQMRLGRFGPFIIKPLHEKTRRFNVVIRLEVVEYCRMRQAGTDHNRFLHREVGTFGKDWFFRDQGCVFYYFRDVTRATHFMLRWVGC